MPEPPEQVRGRGLVRGTASGAVLVSRRPFSFLGDVDIRSGRVTGALSDLLGRNIAGRVLVVPATRGSAGAWRFIYQLKMHGTHPLAIVTDELPDPSVVQGAILAHIPIVSGLATTLGELANDNTIVEVDGATGCVKVPHADSASVQDS